MWFAAGRLWKSSASGYFVPSLTGLVPEQLQEGEITCAGCNITQLLFDARGNNTALNHSWGSLGSKTNSRRKALGVFHTCLSLIPVLGSESN